MRIVPSSRLQALTVFYRFGERRESNLRWLSGRNGLLTGLIVWLVLGLGIGLSSELSGMVNVDLVYSLLTGLLVGLIFGLIFGLLFGGAAFIKHFVLRWFLWRGGSMPWNYPRFLDNAADLILLRKVGGGYIFVHRLLLEYFASLDMTLTPDEIQKSPP
jgi:hypothetical protein